MSLRVKPEDQTGAQILEKLAVVPLSLSNARILKDYLLRNMSHVHLSGSYTQLQLYLRSFDIALAKMYEIQVEDLRRVHSSKDIDIIQERKQLSKDIFDTLNLL